MIGGWQAKFLELSYCFWRSAAQRPPYNDAGEQRGGEPVQKLADDDKSMQTDEGGGFENNRQRQSPPDADGEVHAPLKSGGK